MPASLKIQQTESEEQEPSKLKSDLKNPSLTRTKAEILYLNAKTQKVQEIANRVKSSQNTIKKTTSRWIHQSKEGLWDSPRSRQKRKQKKENIQALKETSEQKKTYNSKQ